MLTFDAMKYDKIYTSCFLHIEIEMFEFEFLDGINCLRCN